MSAQTTHRSPHGRPAGPGSGGRAAPAGAEQRWERQLFARVQRLLCEARAEYGLDVQLNDEPHRPLAAGASALSELASSVVVRVQQLDRRQRAKAASLTGLALRTLELQDDVHRQLTKVRVNRYEQMQRGLDRLRRVGNSADLLDRVCVELVDSCGFARAVLTRIEAAAWLPWMAYFPDDRELEMKFVAWMNEQRFSADALGRDLARLRPVIVDDAVGHAGPFKPMISFSKTPCYVAAPVAPTGRLVGVLYADHSTSGRPVDELDRDVLWAFAEDFGRIYERMVLLERMRKQRGQVREMFEFVESMMASVASAEIELARGSEDRMPHADADNLETPEAAPIVGELLTPREAEVLAMMVRGASNVVIAERLAIKEGTVKSHVKHILRKLDAVNRAEAISRYMGRPQG
jgi:DNA-binding CsgD family transcriptional regulator